MPNQDKWFFTILVLIAVAIVGFVANAFLVSIIQAVLSVIYSLLQIFVVAAVYLICALIGYRALVWLELSPEELEKWLDKYVAPLVNKVTKK